MNLYIGNVRYDREGIATSKGVVVRRERIFDLAQRQRAVADHIDNYRDDLFLKSDDFETETEYRVVLKTDDESQVGYRTDGEGYAYVRYGDSYSEIAEQPVERFGNSLVAVVLG